MSFCWPSLPSDSSPAQPPAHSSCLPPLSFAGDHSPTRRDSKEEQQHRGLPGTAASPDPPCTDAESSREQFQEPFLGEESPLSQSLQLEDATPSPAERGVSSSRKQSEDPLPTILENGADVVTSTSFNGRVSSHTWQNSSPPCKRPRKEKQPLGSGPLASSYVEKQTAQQGNGKNLAASMASVADSSTRVDSPSHGLVSSSLCSSSPSLMTQAPRAQSPRPYSCKMSVATQCDPEEIIVLSDSD